MTIPTGRRVGWGVVQEGNKVKEGYGCKKFERHCSKSLSSFSPNNGPCV